MKVYKNHKCEYGCNKKIPFHEYHKYRGIPKYIRGHNPNCGFKSGEDNPMYGKVPINAIKKGEHRSSQTEFKKDKYNPHAFKKGKQHPNYGGKANTGFEKGNKLGNKFKKRK